MTLCSHWNRARPVYFSPGLLLAAVLAAAACPSSQAQAREPVVIGGSGLPNVEVDLSAIDRAAPPRARAQRRLLMPGTEVPPSGRIVLTPPHRFELKVAPKLTPPRPAGKITLRPPKSAARPPAPSAMAAVPAPKPKPAAPPNVAAVAPEPKPAAKPPAPRAKKRIPVDRKGLAPPAESAVTEGAKARPPVAAKPPEPKPAAKEPAAASPPPPPVAAKAPEPKPAAKEPAAAPPPPPPVAAKPPEPKPAAKEPAAAPPPPPPVAAKAPEPKPTAKEPAATPTAAPADDKAAKTALVAPAAGPDAGSQQLAALPPATARIEPDRPITIGFETGSAELDAAARLALTRVADALNEDAELRLQIVAYATGNDANASQARRTSLSRALAVRSHLIDMGVRSTRMDVRALGNKFKTAPGDRVDLVVVRP